MGNYYDRWLKYWDEEQEERKKARVCISEDELEWVRTKQDWRSALLCAPEIGFVTTGGLRSAFFQSIVKPTFPYKYYEYSSYGKD